MPATKTAQNPRGRTINFTEHDHRYWTDAEMFDAGILVGTNYISGTTFLKKFFKPFDEMAVAFNTAQKKGVTIESVLADWAYTRDTACRFGTRTHEIAEDCLLGRNPRNAPEHKKERDTFTQAWNAACYFKTNAKILAVEQIVFSVDMGIAGTIDFLAQDSAGVIWIMDWKTNKEIKTANAYGNKGLTPIEHLDECEMVKYGLQLSLYEAIMRYEKYLQPRQQVKRAIVHLTETGWQVIETEDFATEVSGMVIRYVTTPPF